MTPLWILTAIVLLSQYLDTTQAEDEEVLIWSTQHDGNTPSDLAIGRGDLEASPLSLQAQPIRFSNETYSDVTSLTFHYLQGMLYVVEARTQAVYRVSLSDLQEEVFHRGFGEFIQISMDWSVGNLYWVDYLYGWLAYKPASSKDVFDFKILYMDMDLPSAIAVDSVRKYVYWAEVGNTPKIRRVRLDGSEPEVVAIGSIFQPYSLTIDPKTGKIFWSDLFKESLEHCNPDGTERGVDRKVRGFSFFDISYYKNTIFATHSNRKILLNVQETTGTLKSLMDVSKYGSPRAITVYSPENQPNVTDSCSGELCSHFCVLGSFGEAKCVCQDGYILQPDGQSCSGTLYSPKLMTFSNKTHVCVANLTAVQGVAPLIVICPVTGNDITAIAPDARNRFIYFSDREEQKIRKVSLDTGNNSTVVNNAGRIEGIAFDWTKNTIYWTDSAEKEIKSFRINSGAANTILVTNDNLGQITLDPYTQKLFWISYNPAKIRSVGLDGKWETTLVSSSITSPGDLFCDPLRQMIFWTDSGYLRSVDETGTDQRQLISTLPGQNRGLLVYKGHYIWASSSPTYINSANKVHHIHSRRVELPDGGDVIDLNVIDTGVQQQNRGPCFNNGGCDHYCLPKSTSRKCRCELGFTLQPDGQTCTSATLQNNFILVSDGLAKRLFQIDLSTQEVVGIGVRGMESLSAVSLDHNNNNRLYWSEPNQRVIKASWVNGSVGVKLIDTGTKRAERLAIDPATGNIYYTAGHPDTKTNHTLSSIVVVSPDGKHKKTLISGLANVRAIHLYSSAGIMFWSQYGTNSRVERANMDGSARQAIITTDNTSWPNGITTDPTAGLLYWTDGKRDVIERCTLYGADRKVIHTDAGAHLMAITFYGDKLYYTAWNRRGVSVVDKDGSNLRVLAESALFARLDDIAVFGPLTQFPGSSNCRDNNGQCSTLCLPKDVGHSCGCADTVELLADGFTCKGVQRCGEIPHGEFEGPCTRYPGVTCSVRCMDGDMISIEEVVCNDGVWSMPDFSVCADLHTEDTSPPPLAADNTIVAVAIGLSALVVIVVIVGVTMVYLRHRNRRSPIKDHINPGVDYINPVSVVNPYVPPTEVWEESGEDQYHTIPWDDAAMGVPPHLPKRPDEKI